MKGFLKLFVVVLILGLVLPASAENLKFKVNLNGGLALMSNSDFNDMIKSLETMTTALMELAYDTVDVTGEEVKMIPAANLELSLQMSSFVAGLKIGMPGTVTSVFTADVSDSPVAQPDIYMETDMKNWAFPFGLNLYYVLPLGEKMNLYVGPGFEYYMSKITNEQTKMTVAGADQTLDEPEIFNGSGIAGVLNVKGEYAINDMFSVYLGVIGRMGAISGYAGEGDLDGTTLYSYDFADEHHWDNLTPEEKDLYDADTTITNLEEAKIDMTGIEFFFGISLNFDM
ncbi:hypothetical protein KAR04_07225 [Candidatus Calescamantes bacterium]|nr:hypothetical protein [Candidatus Calescamantes bacterium]